MTGFVDWCIIELRRMVMIYDEYEYEYHDVAEDADYIDQDDDIYYDDGSDEPWLDSEEIAWDGYYHNITEEIED